MEETLTVTRLGLSRSLLRTLQSTNSMESAISIARTVMRNVKRWRDGKMVKRWTAAGLEVAEKQFRRVNGYRDIPVLVAALRAMPRKCRRRNVVKLRSQVVGSSLKFNGEWDILEGTTRALRMITNSGPNRR
ncbi:hypothetical protein BH20ACT21_BH20ACT21_23070 [soil metagenome]